MGGSLALEVSNKVERSSKGVECHSPAYSTDKSRHSALLSIHLVLTNPWRWIGTSSPIHGDGQAYPVHNVAPVLDTLCMRPRPHLPSPRPSLADHVG